MASPSKDLLLSTERSIRKPGLSAVGSLWLADWIGKFNEHIVLTFLLDHLKEEPMVLGVLTSAINHPVLFLWVLLALYGFTVFFKAKYSMKHGEGDGGGGGQLKQDASGS